VTAFTPRRTVTLHVVRDLGQPTIRQVAARTGTTKAAAEAAVSWLVRAGYVAPAGRADASERHAVRYAVTTEGQAAA
jgi:DNA-binding MarR family transcriptional regulator